MKNFFTKRYIWAVIFSSFIIGSSAFVLLDTFVIPKTISKVEAKSASESSTDNSSTVTVASSDSSTETVSVSQSDAVITDNSYDDENISINIETVRDYDTTLYVADIQLSDASYLQAALANDTYGRNIKETTSDIAESNHAIFAINGDYYGFRNYGYVLRNGVLYRDTVGDGDSLVIDDNGDFSILDQSLVSIDSLDTDSIWQILSFGPALIEDGEIVVNSKSEVSQSKNSNPRTAIGQISALHYIVIVSDGRTNESEGLSLLELAQEFYERGCTIAYNLDGGGSSTMYFNGKVINNPTNGRSNGEREVSDIVYIGY